MDTYYAGEAAWTSLSKITLVHFCKMLATSHTKHLLSMSTVGAGLEIQQADGYGNEDDDDVLIKSLRLLIDWLTR